MSLKEARLQLRFRVRGKFPKLELKLQVNKALEPSLIHHATSVSNMKMESGFLQQPETRNSPIIKFGPKFRETRTHLEKSFSSPALSLFLFSSPPRLDIFCYFWCKIISILFCYK